MSAYFYYHFKVSFVNFSQSLSIFIVFHNWSLCSLLRMKNTTTTLNNICDKSVFKNRLIMQQIFPQFFCFSSMFFKPINYGFKQRNIFFFTYTNLININIKKNNVLTLINVCHVTLLKRKPYK